MEIDIDKPLRLVYKYQKRFTGVQKCVLLGVLGLLMGGALGWWWPMLALLMSLPLSWTTSNQVLSAQKSTLCAFLPWMFSLSKKIKTTWQVMHEKFPFLKYLGVSENKSPEIDSSTINVPTLPENEVNETLEFVHRDFVKSWYGYISDAEAFPDEVMQILEQLSVIAMDRIKQIDIHNVIPEYVVVIRKHFIDYQEALKNLRTQPNVRKKKDRSKEFKKVKSVVDSFSRLGKYHIAVKNEQKLEVLYLQVIIETIFKFLVPENMRRCYSAKELLAEILVCQVLSNIVDMFSEPEFLHKVMVLVLSDEDLDCGDKSDDRKISDKEQNTADNSVKCDVTMESMSSQQGANEGNVISGLNDDADQSKPLTSNETENSSSTPAQADVNQESVQFGVLVESMISQQGANTGNIISRPNDDAEWSKPQKSNETETSSSTHAQADENQESVIKRENGGNEQPARQGHDFQLGLIDLYQQGPNVNLAHGDSTSEEARISTEPEAQVESSQQVMYVSDALAKQFKLSILNSDEVPVIGPLNSDNESLDTDSVFNLSPNNSLEPHTNIKDVENALPEINYTPSFFIDGSDNTSIHSDSSVEPGVHSPDGSVHSSDRSRSISPTCSDRESLNAHQNQPGRLGNVVSDKALQRTRLNFDPRHNSNSNTTNSLNTPEGLVRASSCSNLLTAPRDNQNMLTVKDTGGMRRVASSSALGEQLANANQSSILMNSTSHSTSPLTNSNDNHLRPLQPSEVPISHTMPRHLNAPLDAVPGTITDGPIEATSQDMPEDLFMNVHIYNTEKIRDPSGSVYTIYLITYRAWHLEADTWCLRTSYARRRYREFVTLHDRLDEHPIYKKKIRDVKGPQRWKVLPFGQIEIHGIEARRQFLESYLQALITKDQVGNSLAVREFMAYEGDTRIAFVKKATEVPRIDKMIARTWSGMVNKLTTRPPPKPQPSQRGAPRAHRRHSDSGILGLEDKEDGASCLGDEDALRLDYTYSHSEWPEDELAKTSSEEAMVQTMENVLSHHIHNLEETLGSAGVAAGSSPEESEEDDEGFKDVINEEDDESFKDVIDEVDGDDEGLATMTEAADMYPENALISTLLDLAADLVHGRRPWVLRENLVHCFNAAAADELDKMLHAEIAELVTSEQCARYVCLLRNLLWPCGELVTEPTPALSELQRVAIRSQARRCLVNFLPRVLPIIVGSQDFNAAVDRVMEVIDHPQLNRHLVYTLIDTALQTLFPEINTVKLQRELLNEVKAEYGTSTSDSRHNSISIGI